MDYEKMWNKLKAKLERRIDVCRRTSADIRYICSYKYVLRQMKELEAEEVGVNDK